MAKKTALTTNVACALRLVQDCPASPGGCSWRARQGQAGSQGLKWGAARFYGGRQVTIDVLVNTRRAIRPALQRTRAIRVAHQACAVNVKRP
jgi:hypothetical protein